LLALVSAEGPVADILGGYGLDTAEIEATIGALVSDGTDDSDRALLASLGIDLDRVRETVEAAFGRGALSAAEQRGRRRGRHRRPWGRPRPNGHIRFSPRAKKTLELSLRESLRLKQRHIGTEHLALGILREGQGLACAVLARHGVPFDRLRHDLAVAAGAEAA
jgi:ATP-dependent Clp protease ATP-binding subunit ClpA